MPCEKKIIVIEDDHLLREVIRELLKDSGYKVFTASGGEEGILLTSEIIPDLIVSDIMMPGIDGYEVKKELKKSPEYSSIPFIFLSAKNEMSDLRYGMELGADDYLIKPFQAEQLLHSIQIRLKRSEELKKSNSHNIETGMDPNEKQLSENEIYLVNQNNKSKFLKIDDIVYITAKKEYSDLFLKDKTRLLVRKPLKKWEQKLPSNIFLRIFRSSIVNVNYISKIERQDNNTFKVLLKEFSQELTVSRFFASRLKERLTL